MIVAMTPILKFLIMSSSKRLNERFESFDKKFDEKIEHLDQKIDQKFEYINRKIDERLAAGQRYVESGGNGVTKAYYEKLLEKLKDRIRV